MPTVSAPVETARGGVKIVSNQLTTIQVQTASLELLVGGPYDGHPYGHTALRLTTNTSDRIYDYGRYGKTWGVGNSEGEGVLKVWKNFNAYIAEENSYGRVTTSFQYEVTELQALEVTRYFEAKIAGKKPRAKTVDVETYVIDDYYALGPNCTTLSMEAAKHAIPGLDRDWSAYQKGRGLSMMERGIVSTRGWPKYIFMPADLQEMLQGTTVRRPKSVKTFGSKK
jgi:hypothetical protein